MGFIDSILDIVNKILPSRKAAMVAKLNDLTARYQDALNKGQDTLAASLRLQLIEVRKELGYTSGDV